ncbi:MAG: cysteine peptidase family C39 domain-containing protein, partial [Candidatus Promineifilaceae bacterium]
MIRWFVARLRSVLPFIPRTAVRTPTVIQMEAVECGAASLAIVLGYFGRHVPLEGLRVACGVSRDGSKAGKILAVARRYGLVAKGVRCLSQSVLEGPVPSIVFWNFNHFLVVEGSEGQRIRINDPALGRRTVSRDEFDLSYSGVVLTFEKGPDFLPGGVPPKLLSRLVGQAVEFRTRLGFVLLIGALIALPGFVVPGLTVVFVDQVLVEGLESWLGPLVLLVAGAILVQASLGWLREATLLRL